MFSKPKPTKPASEPATSSTTASAGATKPETTPVPPIPAAKPKPPASILSSDLHITGNLKTSGDIQIEGKIDGDVRAHLLTVGESATIKGEIIADDVVVNGRVVGRVRGLKVRLAASARVEGDIIHKTIAIESGAHFEGSVQRQDDPLSTSGKNAAAPAAAPK